MRAWTLVLGLVGLTACAPYGGSGGPVESPTQQNAGPGASGGSNFQVYRDIPEAPPKIQNAARAVVKIAYLRTRGTGFFLGASTLVTNEHVLGADRCALEGCYIKLHINEQQGQKSEIVKVFAVPVTSSSRDERDIAIYQLWLSHEKQQAFQAPHYLNLAKSSTETLPNSHINVIGHPMNSIKKWSSGLVHTTTRGVFMSEAMALRGNSGSPALNDDGEVVGIISQTGLFGAEDMLRNGITSASFGTTSDEIRDLLAKPPQLGFFHKLDRKHLSSEVVTHAELFLLAGRPSVKMGFWESNVADVLSQACAGTFSLSLLTRTTETACDRYLSWILCNEEMAPHCLQTADQQAAARTQVFSILKSKLEKGDYTPLFKNAIDAYVEPSQRAEFLLAYANSFLEKRAPTISQFLVINFLLEIGINPDIKVNNTNLAAVIASFNSVPGYQLGFDEIVAAHAKIYRMRFIDASEYGKRLRMMASDPKLPLKAKLQIDKELYYLEQK